MREILFRGKRVDNGEWVEGSAINTQYDVRGEKHIYIGVLTKSEMFPLTQTITWYEVIPESIGQYTGLTDKNGKKIFEGDIVLFPWGEKREVFSVEFVEGEFEAIPKRKSTDIWCIRIGSYAPEFEVIGNIHDNPELLEAK